MPLTKQEKDAVYCESCRECADDIMDTDEGPHCAECRYDIGLVGFDRSDPGPDLDTCGGCMTFVLASDGKQTNMGFRCFACLGTEPDSSTPDTCGGCGEFITLYMAADGEMTSNGFRCRKCMGNQERHERAYELLKDDACANLDTCGRCRAVVLEYEGEQTDNGFRCSDCLEVSRKFSTLTDAIEIVQAAVREAYPPTDNHSYIVHISSGGFINILKHSIHDFEEGTPVGGFAKADGLASDMLHRIKANNERAKAKSTGWVKGQAYRDIGRELVRNELGLSDEYTHLKPIEDFENIQDTSDLVLVDVAPCTADGQTHPLYSVPITVGVTSIIRADKIDWLK